MTGLIATLEKACNVRRHTFATHFSSRRFKTTRRPNEHLSPAAETGMSIRNTTPLTWNRWASDVPGEGTDGSGCERAGVREGQAGKLGGEGRGGGEWRAATQGCLSPHTNTPIRPSRLHYAKAHDCPLFFCAPVVVARPNMNWRSRHCVQTTKRASKLPFPRPVATGKGLHFAKRGTSTPSGLTGKPGHTRDLSGNCDKKVSSAQFIDE